MRLNGRRRTIQVGVSLMWCCGDGPERSGGIIMSRTRQGAVTRNAIMQTTILAISLLTALPVMAGPRCSVPLADWKPREALDAKLQGEGWTVVRIKTDDGCYKVYATNAAGRRLRAKFDPATLEIIRREHDDD
jgi:hypothetical protein